VVDSVSSLVPVIAELKKLSGNDNGGGIDPVFMQIMAALAGSTTDLKGASQSILRQVALGMVPRGLSDGAGLGDLLSAGESAGLDSAGQTVDGSTDGESPLAALEMMAALLNAASQLQPWMLGMTQAESGRSGGSDPGLASGESNILALTGQLLSLTPAERKMVLEQALDGRLGLLAKVNEMAAELATAGGESSDSPIVAAAQDRVQSPPGPQPAVLPAEVSPGEVTQAVDAKDNGKSLQDGNTKVIHVGGLNSTAPEAALSSAAGQTGEIKSMGVERANLSQAPAGQTGAIHHSGLTTSQANFDGTGTDSRGQSGLQDQVADVRGTLQGVIPGTVAADLATEGAAVDNAVALKQSVADQIAQQANLLLTPGRKAMTIQLEPKELGKVRVHVSVDASGLHVKMAADMGSTREIIQASLPQLKTAFENQGLKADGFEVAAGPNFGSFGSAQDGGLQQQGNLGDTRTSTPYLPVVEEASAGRAEGPQSGIQTTLVDYRV
jgi:flagellar hook-length control protein FliK